MSQTRGIHLVGGPLHGQHYEYDGPYVGKIEFDIEGVPIIYQMDGYIDPWVATFFPWQPTNEELIEKAADGVDLTAKAKPVVPA